MFSDKPQVGKAGVVYDNNLLDWLHDPKFQSLFSNLKT